MSKKILIFAVSAVLAVGGVLGVFALTKAKTNPSPNQINSDSDLDSSVSEISVKNISFKKSAISLNIGEEINIIDEISDNSENIDFTVDDPSIAEIDKSGNLTALRSGTTFVTAKIKNDDSVTANLKITVIDNSSDTDSSSDTDTAKTTDSDSDTNTETENDISEVSSTVSSAESSKPQETETEKAVASVVSNSDNTPVTTVITQYYSDDGSNNNNTTAVQPETVNSDTNISSENPQFDTPQENTEIPENENNENPENNYEYVDPYSVGKVYPISYVDTEEKKVSISFDASWGNDSTQSILDTLEQNNIKTTFFLVGIWVRDYPEDVKKIAKAGHDIGNHSNTHPDLTQLDSWNIRYEMETCSADIEALTGKRPTLFRNPYGAYDSRVIGTALGLGMDCIQWDVDTLDWTNNSGDEICARIRSRIRNGSIILMHNAGGNTAKSLPMIIQTIYDLGYEIVPISELVPENYTTDITGRANPITNE